MMAETPSKRQREETLIGEEADPKRHHNHTYSYNHILSLLEEDEETLEVEPLPNTQLDFSSILNTLQRELHDDHPSPITGSGSGSGSGSHPDTGDIQASDPSPEPEVETERFMTMRHLLQASDDELGIPNRSDGSGDGEVINGGDAFSVGGDGLWDLEFEDQSANYYTLLQSQPFM